jgi:hypothetical protein
LKGDWGRRDHIKEVVVTEVEKRVLSAIGPDLTVLTGFSKVQV